jgi:[NiFe] hydrogenase assembly HybE family chaperone
MLQAVQKLEAVFSEIAATRMADVPIVNSALRVEAVGFREWQGRWAGVLVTPWTINLMLLPGQDAQLEKLPPDTRATWIFPSGVYEFMGLDEPALGICHICPLISPVHEFTAHEDALAVAREIINALFDAGARKDELAGMIEDSRLKGEALGQKNISRRDFLRMPFGGSY